jgi:Universal stress protein family
MGQMVEKILVTVAGLGQCEQMLKMLLAIPAMQQAMITVLHVVPPQVTAEQMAENSKKEAKYWPRRSKTSKSRPIKSKPY